MQIRKVKKVDEPIFLQKQLIHTVIHNLRMKFIQPGKFISLLFTHNNCRNLLDIFVLILVFAKHYEQEWKCAENVRMCFKGLKERNMERASNPPASRVLVKA